VDLCCTRRGVEVFPASAQKYRKSFQKFLDRREIMNATPRKHGKILHVKLKSWKVGDPEGLLGVQMNLPIIDVHIKLGQA
jgi:hypothetical protein